MSVENSTKTNPGEKCYNGLLKEKPPLPKSLIFLCGKNLPKFPQRNIKDLGRGGFKQPIVKLVKTVPKKYQNKLI